MDLLHQIVLPKLRGGWRHDYTTKTRLAGHAEEQSFYSLMSMIGTYKIGWTIVCLRS